MELTFFGAARTTTGSMYRVQTGGAAVLLDCGLYQGHYRESHARNSRLPFDPRSIDACILSHAHLDHSGNLPTLMRGGFGGNVWSTPGTRDLCAAMLRDAANIQEQDAAYLNRKRDHLHEEPVPPLYSVADATRSLGLFVDLCYERPFQAAPGIVGTFYDAGHILGSAIVALDLESEPPLRLCYTGDLGCSCTPILRTPATVPDVDVLIIESTYGNRLHESPEEAEERLGHVVTETWRRGGRLIIPAFAVGRTQVVVHQLHRLMLRKDIPDLLIFVDSPLAVNVTEIFRLHPECLSDEAIEAMGKEQDPFGFGRLHYVHTVEQSKELNFLREPAVIISASGMAQAGRILHHLRNNLPDARNTVLLVGYQAPDTLGRRLLERPDDVTILGEKVPVRADVQSISGYSAHADRAGLLRWVQSLDPQRLRQVYVVHGEEDSALSLASALRAIGVPQVHVPGPGETVELRAVQAVRAV
ncbi:MAG: MBL fold metallo-hydrolase RNA specificity domain-containing protein [Anaerolineae bacterium]